jgi:hypothetical protein
MFVGLALNISSTKFVDIHIFATSFIFGHLEQPCRVETTKKQKRGKTEAELTSTVSSPALQREVPSAEQPHRIPRHVAHV